MSTNKVGGFGQFHRTRILESPKRSISLIVVFFAASSILWLALASREMRWSSHPHDNRRPIGGGISLRILPLGDSITEGYASSDFNGYRLFLRNDILRAGNDVVHFIGSLQNGINNTENHHEGHGGFRTIQILEHLVSHKEVLQESPNVVLLHAGTNDVNALPPPPEPYETAPERLGDLIDAVLHECPETVLLVAKIINADASQHRVDSFNAAIPLLVEERRRQGHKIVIVDHTNVGGRKLADGLHPNDKGYEIMAQNWLHALQELPEGWIRSPS